MLKKGRVFSSRDSYSLDSRAYKWPKVDAQARVGDSAKHFAASANPNVANDMRNDAFWDQFMIVDSDSAEAREYSPPRPVRESPSSVFCHPLERFSVAAASSPPQALAINIVEGCSASPDTRFGIRNNKEHHKAPVPYSFTFASSSELPSPQPLPASVQAQLAMEQGELGSWEPIVALTPEQRKRCVLL
jgi:hypothetical protein